MRRLHSDRSLFLALVVLFVWIIFSLQYDPSFGSWRQRHLTALHPYSSNIHELSPGRVGQRKSSAVFDDNPHCDVWSSRSLFFTSSRSLVSHNTLSSLLRHSTTTRSQEAVVESIWTHERTELERYAKVRTIVFHCGNPDLSPTGEEANNTANKECDDSNNDFKRIDNDRYLNPRLILCRCMPKEDSNRTKRRTAVIEIPDSTWNELMPTANEGANLWHFHAASFRVWLSVRAIDAVRAHFHSQGDVDRTTSWHARDIVMLLSNKAFGAMGFPSALDFVHVTDESLLDLHNIYRAHRSSIEGLQGVADALGNRLILSRKEITRPALTKALRNAKLSTVIDSWVIPPHDGFLWDIAHDDTLSGKIVECHNSLLQQYGNDLLYSSSRLSLPKYIGMELDSNVSNGHHEKTSIAKHVCVVSRQSRDRPGSSASRGNLRNLTPETLLRILSSLPAPVLLTPSLGLRRSFKTADEGLGPVIQLHLGNMTHATISEQLWYIHQECGVVLGVHGAGLTNAIGLRRGTAIVELMPKGKRFQYFRNIAALLDDTTYDVIFIGDGSEQDLSMNEEEVNRFVMLVNERLADGVRKQATHLSLRPRV